MLTLQHVPFSDHATGRNPRERKTERRLSVGAHVRGADIYGKANMTNRNWDAARARDRARKPVYVPEQFDQTPEIKPNTSAREPFPQVYARYAKAERQSGRQPLPPRQWIASLQKAKEARINQPD